MTVKTISATAALIVWRTSRTTAAASATPASTAAIAATVAAAWAYWRHWSPCWSHSDKIRYSHSHLVQFLFSQIFNRCPGQIVVVLFAIWQLARDKFNVGPIQLPDRLDTSTSQNERASLRNLKCRRTTVTTASNIEHRALGQSEPDRNVRPLAWDAAVTNKNSRFSIGTGLMFLSQACFNHRSSLREINYKPSPDYLVGLFYDRR